MARTDLRARGDVDLVEELLREEVVRAAIEEVARAEVDQGARRQLLGNAIRLTREMATDVHQIVEEARARLELDTGPGS